MATNKNPNIKPQKFDYFLVLDFEATCLKDQMITPVQEVIEFPVLKVNAKTFIVEAEFHRYVQPKINKKLTPFCTQLTGITQDKVDGQPTLEETLTLFHTWMQEQGLLASGVKFVFVSCGKWDLQEMLPLQSKHFKFNYNDYLKQWINIKPEFRDVFPDMPEKFDMVEMLDTLKIKLEGRHHSGIDDVRNIARILKGLAERGHVFGEKDRVGQLSS